MGLPCGSAGKQSDCSAGDLGSIPGLGRSPEKGKGYPLQYSGLENSIWLYSPWGCKESDTTAIFTLGTLIIPRPPTFLPFFCSFLNHSPSDFFLFYLTFFFFLKNIFWRTQPSHPPARTFKKCIFKCFLIFIWESPNRPPLSIHHIHSDAYIKISFIISLLFVISSTHTCLLLQFESSVWIFLPSSLFAVSF